MKTTRLSIVSVWLLSTLLLSAAPRQLSSTHVPAPVARGEVAPLGRLPGTNRLDLAVCLPLRNKEALTNLLMETYNSSSTNYHRYLTPEQFTQMFGPTEADYEAVKAYARSNGLALRHSHPNRVVLDVSGTVADLEKAFHLKLNIYRHPLEQRTFHAPDAEPTPDISVPLAHISGLDDYAMPRPRLQTSPAPNSKNATRNTGSGPGGYYSGGDFRAAYAPGTSLDGSGQVVGLLQFDGYSAGDIAYYENAAGLPNVTLTNVLVDGFDGTPSGGGGQTEASLDIEMVISMAPNVSEIIVYESISPFLWHDVLNRMATDNLARQISCSWFIPEGSADAVTDGIFQQMALQGQAFFAASGDSDAYAGLIDFPGDTPYITQVGGTTLNTTGPGGPWFSEQAWNRNNGQGTGGGISTQYPIPAWQAIVNMSSNNGSMTRRNVPDVAMIAEDVYVRANGQDQFVGGTSCAAPLWAGFAALVNQQAAQLGLPPAGFLNPALYTLAANSNSPALFHDIVTGNNTNASSPAKFFAVPGYDLCTGLGTPNGTNLINALVTPDPLGVGPPSLSSSGLVGGPFSPTNWVLLLTNNSGSPLDWSLAATPSWLSVPANHGTLPANGSSNIILKLNAPESLPAFEYGASLIITNKTSGRIQLLSASLAVGQSIVQNGGFETGDFTGWTLVGDTVDTNYIYNAAENGNLTGIVHSGISGAFLGEGGFLATLTQALPTASGQKYQLSFWLDNPQSGGGQQFIARWNGSNLVNFSSPPAFGWTNYQFLLTAPGTNTVLQFAARNDPNYFGLDDVAVTPLPPLWIGNVAAGEGNVLFAWNTLAGIRYQVQFTTNLSPAAWQNLAVITATTNVAGYSGSNVLNSGGGGFYRLMLLQ
jgi:hypothetical protein